MQEDDLMRNGITGERGHRFATPRFFFGRWAFFPAGLALLLGLSPLGLATAARAQNVEFHAQGDTMRFNRFTVTRAPEKAEGEDMARLLVAYGDGQVHAGEVSRLTLDNVTLRLALPKEDMATLLVTTFSGGAHCCFETCLLTSGPAGDEFARVALEHGPAPVINEDGTLAVPDWKFAYYASKAGSVSFSFAASPAVKRLLVHDAGGWRADRPGDSRSIISTCWRPWRRKPSGCPCRFPRTVRPWPGSWRPALTG
jgi:hypothetical protein